MGDPCDLAPMWESLNHCLSEDLRCAPALLGHPGDPPDRGILGEERVRRSEGNKSIKVRDRQKERVIIRGDHKNRGLGQNESNRKTKRV